MNLSKKQREVVRGMYGRCCAYCGNALNERWHADHLVAVQRISIRRKGTYVATGAMHRPEHDHISNMVPACVPCNIDKSDLPLEVWRKRIEGLPGVLTRNSTAYKHASRFKMVEVIRPSIQFHFETYRSPRRVIRST